MPLARGEIQIGAVVLQPMPYRWPENAWSVLELELTEEQGWATLNSSAYQTLRGYYNAAFGSVEEGLGGLVVQFVEGRESGVVTVNSWDGNSGSFVFSPRDGFEVSEIPGSAEASGGPYYVGTLRLIRVG